MYFVSEIIIIIINHKVHTFATWTNGITFFMYFFRHASFPNRADIILLSGNPVSIYKQINNSVIQCLSILIRGRIIMCLKFDNDGILRTNSIEFLRNIK